MRGFVIAIIAIGLLLLGSLIIHWRHQLSVIIWKIVRTIKKISIRNHIYSIEETYLRASGSGKKIGLFEKGKVKQQYNESKGAFDEYVQFCYRKELPLSSKETRLISIIQETDDLLDPAQALDRALSRASSEYDEVYQLACKSGEELLAYREDAAKTVEKIESLVNSIAKHPKEFDKDIKEITVQRTKFFDALEFGQKQQKALKHSAEGAGAGVAAGAAVASMAPTAAMWVATTFGTASTGTAISALSGAAATNAALAWLGGGAVAAGGAGMAAGKALLALAGPIGWGVAGGSLLLSVLLFWRKKMKIQESKKEEVARIKNCTAALQTVKAQMDSLAIETKQLNASLDDQFQSCKALQSGDYTLFSQGQRDQLGAVVNNTKALSFLLSKVLATEDNNDNSSGKKKTR